MSRTFYLKSSREVVNFERAFNIRVVLALFLIAFFFSVLVFRMYYLQIERYQEYYDKAEDNSTSRIPIPPARGLIYDRNGEILAENYPAYTLEVDHKFVSQIPGLMEELKGIISFSEKDISEYKRQIKQPDMDSIVLKTDLDDAELAKFASISYLYPALRINARLFRFYPYGQLTSHFLGYVGRISEGDKAKLVENGRDKLYVGSQYIGKVGLEYQYEEKLHGRPGQQDVQVNSSNRVYRVLGVTPDISGGDLYLTLDINLQRYASELVGNRRGAVVALDPRNGEILAFLSSPSFDPHPYVTGFTREQLNYLNNNWRSPQLNRVTQGLYPPGSTFKPFMAIAALETGERTPSQVIYDPGYFVLPNSDHRFRDSYAFGRGSVNLKKAIQVSSDTYFYKLAWDMGIDKIAPQIARFGFGSKTGVDIPNETEGILPSREWKEKRFSGLTHGGWVPADVVSIGIGQGYNSYTPMQLVFATSVIANNGIGYKPHFVKRIVTNSESGSYTEFIKPEIRIDGKFKQENIKIVKDAMEAVMEQGGTAYRVGQTIKGYKMAGKTGTSQVVAIKQEEKYDAATLDLRLRDHSLFVAYAPADNPKIAVAVVIENGGWGSAAALPVAKKFVDYYLLGIKAPPDEIAYSSAEEQDYAETEPKDR